MTGAKKSDGALTVKAKGKYSNTIAYTPKQPDKSPVDAVVDAVNSSDGVVDPKWLKTNVRWVTTVKQAKELLEEAWNEGRLRRFKDGRNWVYEALYADEEWAKLISKQNDAFKLEQIQRNAEYAISFKNEMEARIAESRKAEGDASREVKLLSSNIDALTAKLEKCDARTKKAKQELAEAQEQEKRIAAELSETGFFSFGKKKELKAKLAQVRANIMQVESLIRELSKESKADSKTLSTKRMQLGKREKQLATATRKISSFEKKLAKGCGPLSASQEELAQHAESIVRLWASPVSAKWLVDNVAGIDSEKQVRELLSSPSGELVFKELDNRLFHSVKDIPLDSGSIALGEKVTLGRWRDASGVVPLSWTVLDVDNYGRKALLLCDCIVEHASFNKGKMKGSWDGSSLASWLDSDFVDVAFSDAEREAMQVRSQMGRAFCLSMQEFELHKLRPGIEEPTVLAPRGTKWDRAWWLRTSSDTDTRAMYVTEKNGISKRGAGVDQSAMGVRPAIWVSTRAFEDLQDE